MASTKPKARDWDYHDCVKESATFFIYKEQIKKFAVNVILIIASR